MTWCNCFSALQNWRQSFRRSSPPTFLQPRGQELEWVRWGRGWCRWQFRSTADSLPSSSPPPDDSTTSSTYDTSPESSGKAQSCHALSTSRTGILLQRVICPLVWIMLFLQCLLYSVECFLLVLFCYLKTMCEPARVTKSHSVVSVFQVSTISHNIIATYHTFCHLAGSCVGGAVRREW